MRHLKYILILIFIPNIASAQADNLAEAITEMERVYKETLDADLGIKTCKRVLKNVPQYSKIYFKSTMYLGEWYIINRDEKAIKALLHTLKVDIENAGGKDKNKTAWIYYLHLNSMYNSEIIYNVEKAVIQGVLAFYMAKGKPKVLTKITPQTATALAGVAQYSTAQDFIKIYEISEKFNKKTDLERCKYLLRLGRIYYKAENWEKSNDLLEEALAIIKPKSKQYPHLYEDCIVELVRVKAVKAVNDTEEIDKLFTLLSHHEKRDYEYWEEYATHLYRSEKIDSCLVMAQKGLVEVTVDFSSKNIVDNPSKDADYIDYQKAERILLVKSLALQSKGLEVFNEGNKVKAIELFEKSIETAAIGVEIYNRLIDDMVGFSIADMIATEEINVLMGAMIHSAFGLYKVTQRKEDFNRLFYYMEQRRGLSILQRTTESPIPIDLLPKFEDYFKDIEYYETIFVTANDASFEKLMEVSTLTFEYEAFFETVKKQTPKVRLTTGDFEYISADALQASLNDETVFIQYSVIRHHIYAISMTKDKVTAKLVYAGNEMFEQKVYPYLDRIKNPLIVQQNNRTAFIYWSHYFYDVLIRPFESEMNGKTRFVISPERELMFLPYETLLKSADDKPFHELDFLIKAYEINYRYSATLHQKVQARPPIKDYSTLAFAPIFDNGQGTGKNDKAVRSFRSYSSMDNKKFVYLPNSKKEVETIKELILHKNEVTILLKENATKENLRQKITVNSYQFIHIATHSMVNFDDPRISSIACYQVNNEENLYFSREIKGENIRADLVILSSCESGVGRIIEGEGIIGLNRSFIASGARNVLFSLWKVDDKGSTELMINFYKFYLNNEDYTTALHQAKLKMLDDETMANPRYWAAFVLIGE